MMDGQPGSVSSRLFSSSLRLCSLLWVKTPKMLLKHGILTKLVDGCHVNSLSATAFKYGWFQYIFIRKKNCMKLQMLKSRQNLVLRSGCFLFSNCCEHCGARMLIESFVVQEWEELQSQRRKVIAQLSGRYVEILDSDDDQKGFSIVILCLVLAHMTLTYKDAYRRCFEAGQLTTKDMLKSRDEF